MNIGYTLEGAKGVEDVATFPGRIGHHGGKVLFKGGPQFGASTHVARLILNFMKNFQGQIMSKRPVSKGNCRESPEKGPRGGLPSQKAGSRKLERKRRMLDARRKCFERYGKSAGYNL